MADRKKLLVLFCSFIATTLVSGQQMVTKYLHEFATPGGGGYPNDQINDHQAFVDAAAFFQARNGYGTLVLDSGEYIMGVQQLRNVGDPDPPTGWDAWRYPLGNGPDCQSLVASQDGFNLDSCFNFTIQGGISTSVRYRDCLYYGTFVVDDATGDISSAVGAANDTVGCLSCEQALHETLGIGLRHAAVGVMFTFTHCDSITLRNVELNGNIDAAILGGKVFFDGMQTAYDGVMIWESSRCLIDNVHAHHFGRDGLQVSGNHTSALTPFMERYPELHVTLDPVDSLAVDSNRTVIFNNRIQHSSFNWNTRQGISWTGCAGLQVVNCDLNYNAAGRLASSPGTGLDIEGVGGPMRVRYGVFDDCRFLHNLTTGIFSDNGQCLGQQDFRFNNCVVKAGTSGSAIWPEARGIKFDHCEIYGNVGEIYEQAENITRVPDFDLRFTNTNFYEEDDQWSYIKWYQPITGDSCAAGPHMFQLGKTGRARVHFDSCGFYTNCNAIVRLKGKPNNITSFNWCRTCPDCDDLINSCADSTCWLQGPCIDCAAQDDRYVYVRNCEFVNTGRQRCSADTEVFSAAFAMIENMSITLPATVRGGGPGDDYSTPMDQITGCAPSCVDTTMQYTTDPFPACKPFFALPDTIDRWAYCNPSLGNIVVPTCGSYTLTKTATPSETQIDSTVTFTITVCNNTAVAGPVLLSEQLPPSFVVNSADTLWNGADTTLTINNGHCAVLQITGFFTAFGDYINSVTLDTDTAVAGAELSASDSVSVVSACPANTVIPDSSLATIVGTVFSGTVNIQGLFIVDDDVLFQNAEVYMEPGAEIVVQPGWMLDIINSSVESCQNVMWKSITAENGSTVRIWNSFVDDAENVVSGLDGSTLWLRDSQFHNNRNTVHVPSISGVPFNNVSVYVSGNTFYSQGAMPVPYPGQTSAVGLVGFAAADVYNMALDFTGGNNIIHSMSNGIVARRSNVGLNGCTMHNIQPDAAYASVANGAGVYARGGNDGWYTLKQQGFGATAAPSFDKCRWGIYTEYMNVWSGDNNMLGMGTAYRVDRSGGRFVDILNNTVSTEYHGMELRANDGAAHILVEGNDITFGGDDACTACKGYTAIQVTEGNMDNTDSRILGNTIHFLPQNASRFGIFMNAANDWLVASNTLQMADNAHNRTGIQLSGCNRPEVSCNTVKGATNGYPVDVQAAIRNAMGNDVLISCNDVDSTANGILFNGVAPNTEVRGNFFHNHKWGLHLDGTAVIGLQDKRGNLWDLNAAAPVWGAWYESTDNAPNNPFFYKPDTINAGTTLPPSLWPPGWFNFALGTNYDCSDDEGEDYCIQFKQRGKEQLNMLDVLVATDSLANDPYTNETKWMLRGRLYKKLDENPELQDSLQTMADLYDELHAGTTAAFKVIDDEQLSLYELDSTVVAQLQQNGVLIEEAMDQIKNAMDDLGDSTLTATQRQLLLGTTYGHRAAIGGLSTWNNAAMQLAASSKALVSDNVKAMNAAMSTSELIETNQKGVNDIYLAIIGKDVDTFTSYQAAALFDIASQCPMLGGNAVFKARSLYWLVDGAQEFDDVSICLTHGITVKSSLEQQSNALRVIPNPASDEATLVVAHALKDPGTMILHDAIGAEVMRLIIPAETVRFPFSTVSLAPAMYNYKVLARGGMVGHGKLTIVR